MKKQNSSRKLRRFFTREPLKGPAQELWLDSAETRHLRDSIRLDPGDTCLVTDGEGREAEALICDFMADGRAHLKIERLMESQKTKDGILLRVAPVMLRQGKTDLLVEKAQELGVTEIWPLSSERCEIKIPKEKIGKTVERWNRIVREASKQSGSLTMARVAEPRGFKEAIEAVPAGEPLVIFHPSPEAVPFVDWIHCFQAIRPSVGALTFFIGPEGGFSDDEIAWAQWKRKDKNFWIVSLGEVRLRADTALIGTLAAFRFSAAL